MRALFDTNVLIDFLGGVPQARDEISLYEEKAISVVTWMEVMLGATENVAEATEAFLRGFILVGLDDRVAHRAVALRRGRRLKLPDAIIWASAQVHGLLLVTRNTEDFPAIDPSVRAPYRV